MNNTMSPARPDPAYRLLGDKYGEGRFDKGTRSEHNQIKNEAVVHSSEKYSGLYADCLYCNPGARAARWTP
jgi:hypothetical protein